jgi:uncharacterized membrane protein YoaK (UPF0700 family)
MKLLPGVLSLIAGSADVISFLWLGVFTAHITGNLVIAAAYVVTGQATSVTLLLSVPVFILVLGLAALLAAGLEAVGRASLRPLLLLQVLLLAGMFGLSLATGTRIDRTASTAIFAGLLGVSAMAVQNVMAQAALRGAPSTAVMTTNLTRFTIDVGQLLLGRDPPEVATARERARHTWPSIVGFIGGAGLGAACFAAVGPWSLALPVGLALLALALALATGEPEPGSGLARESVARLPR